mgnify:CR=1 FL=1
MGVVCPESSGLLTAMANYANKLLPSEFEPTVILENNDKQCIIQANKKLVVSVYRTLSPK